MYTLSSFRRRLVSGETERDVALEAGWPVAPAQEHHGENIGDTATHVLFVELKEPRAEGSGDAAAAGGTVGPQTP